jgi:hypothetical protein
VHLSVFVRLRPDTIPDVEPLVLGAAIAAVGVMIALTMRARAVRDALPRVEVHDGCTVRLDVDLAGFTVEPVRAFPPRLEMNFGLQDRWTSGDTTFDRRVRITAEERWLLARLSEEVRGAILELDRVCSCYISEGVLRGRVFAGPVRMRAAIQRAVRVALLLSEPIDVVSATADNARRDGIARVRKHCLTMLIRDHAPVSKALAHEMLQDPDPEVRLIAAEHAGPKAVSVLWELACDPTLSHQLRASAVGKYVALEMFDEARAKLLTLASEHQPAPIRAAVARAARMIGGPFEPVLIGMLKSDDDVVLREAVKALARIGTIASVEPLLLLAARSSAADDVRSWARRTVATIQSAQRGESGRLSVVEPSADGKLSVAEGGRLSMEDDDSRER